MSGRLAATFLAGVLLLSACNDGREQTTPSATGTAPTATAPAQGRRVTFEGPFITSNRSVRSLCVDGAEGISVSRGQVAMIRQAVVDALDSHPYLEAQGEPVVSAGCPPPTGLTDQPVPDKNRGGTVVDSPSEHMLFVYIVPDNVFSRSFGEVPYGTATEEFFCGGSHNCAAVTEGLYVPPSVSPEALQVGLLDALGFR